MGLWDIDISDKKNIYYGLSAIGIGICGILCVYKLNDINNRRRLINFYRDNRRMINVGIARNNLASIRIMSYNILADGNRYALNTDYGYTPLRFRKWNYRQKRILSEINAYYPDIVGLQETTYKTYHNSLQIEFDLMGYESIHCIRNEQGHKHGFNGTTDCMLFNKKKFNLLNSKIIRFNNECDKDKYDKYFGDKLSKFRSKTLKNCPDVLMVLYLQIREKPKIKFIACSTHLHYNPRMPHIKLAQTLMLNQSLNDLITNEWNLNLDEIGLICCGDFNALPFKNEPDEYDPFIQENETMISGVYKLMTQCNVGISHEDHPKRRLYEKIYRSIYYQQMEEEKKNQEDDDEEEIKEQIQKVDIKKEREEIIAEKRSIDIEKLAETVSDIEKYPQLKELEFIENLIDYSTNIRWKSVYETACNEPVWTNHTKSFSGTIDYIFCNDNFRILSYLEHPTQNKLSYHKINLKSMININNNVNENDKNDDFIKLEKEKEKENAKNFPPLPNKNYVSDHLCLVTDLEFMPTKLETNNLIQKLTS